MKIQSVDMLRGFSRQEASLISGLSLNQLDYLNRNEIVKPEKAALSKRATVLYSWNQLLELKTIAKLKDVKTPERIIYVLVDSLRNKLKLKVKWNELGEVLSQSENITLDDFKKTLVIVESTNQLSIFKNVKAQPCTVNSSRPLEKVGTLYVIDEKDEFVWLQAMKNAEEYGLQDMHVIPPLGNIAREVEMIAKLKVDRLEERLQKVS